MKLEHTSLQPQNTDTNSKLDTGRAERLVLLSQEVKSQEEAIREEKVAGAQSKERIEQAIADINQFIKPMHGQKISFELREDVDETVAFVQDKQTGEVIRQVPSEEILKIHAQIKALQEQGDESALSLLSNFRA